MDAHPSNGVDPSQRTSSFTSGNPSLPALPGMQSFTPNVESEIPTPEGLSRAQSFASVLRASVNFVRHEDNGVLAWFQENVDKKDKEIKELNEINKNLTGQLATTKAEKSATAEEEKRLRLELSQTRTTLSQDKEKIGSLELKLTTAEEENNDLLEQIAELEGNKEAELNDASGASDQSDKKIIELTALNVDLRKRLTKSEQKNADLIKQLAALNTQNAGLQSRLLQENAAAATNPETSDEESGEEQEEQPSSSTLKRPGGFSNSNPKRKNVGNVLSKESWPDLSNLPRQQTANGPITKDSWPKMSVAMEDDFVNALMQAINFAASILKNSTIDCSPLFKDQSGESKGNLILQWIVGLASQSTIALGREYRTQLEEYIAQIFYIFVTGKNHVPSNQGCTYQRCTAMTRLGYTLKNHTFRLTRVCINASHQNQVSFLPAFFALETFENESISDSRQLRNKACATDLRTKRDIKVMYFKDIDDERGAEVATIAYSP
ncbi:MAG: hypothetical protein ABW189_00255 [Rickettsiales bacterium]